MKKINSELKLENDKFKLKMGTVDKKNPETIYLEVGTYITPLNQKESYSEDIEMFDEKIRKYLTNFLKYSQLYNKDFIFVTDVADERIMKGKKSYLELQLFLKPSKSALLACNYTFKDIVCQFDNEYLSSIIPYIANSISDMGFSYSKRKN